MRFVECCAAGYGEALEAFRGGADRIELCSRLDVGGVTPPADVLKAVLRDCPGLKVNVLVRSREGSFVYTRPEVDEMVRSILLCRELGVNGVVVGALTPSGEVDVPAVRRFLEAAGPLETTFHRAFDVCADPVAAFDTIAALGFTRLLTSGHENSAWEGRELIRELVVRSKPSDLVVMAGAGVNPANISALEAYTSAPEYHSSARDSSGRTSSSVVLALRGVNY